MSETRENDLVAVLNEKDALIERLQKELKEAQLKTTTLSEFKAKYREANAGKYMGSAVAQKAREQTIEDCARVAYEYARATEGFTEEHSAAVNIAKAIRSMDGGGK